MNRKAAKNLVSNFYSSSREVGKPAPKRRPTINPSAEAGCLLEIINVEIYDFTTIVSRRAEPERFLGRFLEHRQDITGGVFEPGDQWPAAAKDSLLVGFEVTLIALKAHASLRELVHGFLNIVDREIENSEGRRNMIRLGVDEHRSAAGKVQIQ